MRRMALAVLVVTLSTPPVFAQDTAATKETSKDHPCKRIEQACKDAGFVKGGAKDGKGLKANCIKPILKGQSVEGVNVDAATLKSCQENVAKAAQHKDTSKEGSGNTKQ